MNGKLLNCIICHIIIYIFATFSGCAPMVRGPIIIPEIEIQRDEKPVIPRKIKKPKKPNPILLNTELTITKDPNEIKYFAFTPDEFKKIIQLSQSFDAQNNLIESYVELVNLKIEINNDLINMLNHKRETTQYYADLYINENNVRLQENYIRERERILDKSIIILQSIVMLAIIL